MGSVADISTEACSSTASGGSIPETTPPPTCFLGAPAVDTDLVRGCFSVTFELFQTHEVELLPLDLIGYSLKYGLSFLIRLAAGFFPLPTAASGLCPAVTESARGELDSPSIPTLDIS
jgi:hypothetical protein